MLVRQKENNIKSIWTLLIFLFFSDFFSDYLSKNAIDLENSFFLFIRNELF